MRRAGWVVRSIAPDGQVSYIPDGTHIPLGAGIVPIEEAQVFPERWLAEEMADIANAIMQQAAPAEMPRKQARRIVKRHGWKVVER